MNQSTQYIVWGMEYHTNDICRSYLDEWHFKKHSTDETSKICQKYWLEWVGSKC